MPLGPKYNSVTITKKNYLRREDNSSPPGRLLPQGGGWGVYFLIMVYTGRLPRKGLGISLRSIERVEKSMIAVCKRPERFDRFILFL